MTPNVLESDAPVKVLLVDDEENGYLLISHYLSKVPGKKFLPDWAGSFEEGLKAVCRKEHDVYLLDYRLGARTGLDLLTEAVKCGVKAPIILLTGGADPKVDLEATRIGAADFLLKDKLDSATLERSIRYSLQHFETLRALEKSNERFRLLFERSLDAILISDDNGKILEANGAACLLLKYSHDELLDRTVQDLFRRDVKNPVQLNPQSDGELSFTLSNGDRHYVEFSTFRFAPNLNMSILRDITDRRKLEQEIQEISEREQRRLGQDLHDGLGQALTGIGCLTKVLQQKLVGRRISEAHEAGNIVALISQALSQTREMARGLCPVVLENNDIHAALQQLSDNLISIFGVSSQLKFDPKVRLTDNAVATHLYRIAQEATTNAIKHGKASKVHISLVRVNGQTILEISDDGVGIPAEKRGTKGMGLRVMDHRARMIGATLEIQGGKRGGTVVTCSLEKRSSSKQRLRSELNSKN